MIDVDQQLGRTERQLDRVTSVDETWKTSLPTQELPDSETLNRLTFVDFSDLESRDSLSAATEAVQRLDSAVTRVLDYFKVPTAIKKTSAVGPVMTRITGDERWPEFMDTLNDTEKVVSIRLPRLFDLAQKANTEEAKTQAEESAKETIGLIYRTANLLPNLVGTKSVKLDERPHEPTDIIDT